MTTPPAPSRRRAFLFAGGGTGGHIYPALAIIEQLRFLDPSSTIALLCSDRAIDAKVLSPTGVEHASLPAKPFSVRPKGFARFIANWGPSLRQTRQKLSQLKRDHDAVVLVAMGGFVAAPAARAARCEQVPVLLVNLDAVPGKANELIAKNAARVVTSAQVQGHEGWERVRPIVRAQTLERRDPAASRQAFGLDPDTPTLLVTGGSQGAGSINDFIAAFAKNNPGALDNWQVIHQVGVQISDTRMSEIAQIYADSGASAWVDRYITDMGAAYGAADLGLGRCGAGSVAEAWGASLPSVFMPYPHHKDQHQLRNAQVLVDAGAAVIFADHVDAQKNHAAHHETLRALLGDPRRREKMRQAQEKLGPPDGAARVGELLISLA